MSLPCAAPVATNHTKVDDSPALPPLRDCERLWVSSQTLQCAKHCVPCAYKIGCFDVARDREFVRRVPNQRPEQCPRLKTKSSPRMVPSFCELYRDGMSILTVGDGDLSYSLALARHLHHSHIVATSYERRTTWLATYPDARSILEALEQYQHVQVRFEVDATRLMSATLQYDVIVWNFPCTAELHGQDGQNGQMEHNKRLLRDFVLSSHSVLRSGGQIHMAHKTKPPFNQWDIEKVVVQAAAKTEQKLLYYGRVVLDRALVSPYVPRKALDRKSFPCHDACIYVFGTDIAGGCAKNSVVDEKDASPTIRWNEGLVPVTEEVLRDLRHQHFKGVCKSDMPVTERQSKRQKR